MPKNTHSFGQNFLRPLTNQLSRAFVGHRIQLQPTNTGRIRVNVNGQNLQGEYDPNEQNVQSKIFGDIRQNLVRSAQEKVQAETPTPETPTPETPTPETPTPETPTPCFFCGQLHEQEEPFQTLTREGVIYAIRRSLVLPVHEQADNIAAELGLEPHQIRLEGSLPNPTLVISGLLRGRIQVSYQEAIRFHPTSEHLREVVQFITHPSPDKLVGEIASILGCKQVTIEGEKDNFSVSVTNEDGTHLTETFRNWFGSQTQAPNGRALIEQAVATLNDAYTRDPLALYQLVTFRAFCNDNLADSPTVYVSQVNPITPQPQWAVGLVGLLNSVLEPLTGHRVASRWSEVDTQGQRQFLGFVVYDIPQDERVDSAGQPISTD